MQKYNYYSTSQQLIAFYRILIQIVIEKHVLFSKDLPLVYFLERNASFPNSVRPKGQATERFVSIMHRRNRRRGEAKIYDGFT